MRRASPILPVALSTLAIACGGDDGPPEGCDRLVTAGSADDQGAVQTALVEVAAGQTLCFEGSFTFTDELALSTSGVTLRGVGTDTTFDFTGSSGANGLRVQAVTGFTIEDMRVTNTPGDGIRVENSTDVTFRRTHVIWEGEPSVDNGAYGLYPVGCTNVLIEDSEVTGARDAGIYVGQSTNVVVRNSTAHGNVAGIEIENTDTAEVYGNEAYDNTAGILVFDLPGLPAGQGGRTHVHDNDVHDNNRMTFAEPGTIVGSVPAGTGIMSLTMDEVEISANQVRNNNSLGVVVVSWQIAALLVDDVFDHPDYDEFAETIFVHDNTFENNGTMPAGVLAALGLAAPVEDIIWDGIVDPAKDNTDGHLSLCIQETGADFRSVGITIGPPPDNMIMMAPSTDLAPHDCTHASLPPVVLP